MGRRILTKNWPLGLAFSVAFAGCAGTPGGVGSAPSGSGPRLVDWRARAKALAAESESPAARSPAGLGANTPGDTRTASRPAPGAGQNPVSDKVAKFFPMFQRDATKNAQVSSGFVRPSDRDVWADATRVKSRAGTGTGTGRDVVVASRESETDRDGGTSVLPVALEIGNGPGGMTTQVRSRGVSNDEPAAPSASPSTLPDWVRPGAPIDDSATSTVAPASNVRTVSYERDARAVADPGVVTASGPAADEPAVLPSLASNEAFQPQAQPAQTLPAGFVYMMPVATAAAPVSDQAPEPPPAPQAPKPYSGTSPVPPPSVNSTVAPPPPTEAPQPVPAPSPGASSPLPPVDQPTPVPAPPAAATPPTPEPMTPVPVPADQPTAVPPVTTPATTAQGGVSQQSPAPAYQPMPYYPYGMPMTPVPYTTPTYSYNYATPQTPYAAPQTAYAAPQTAYFAPAPSYQSMPYASPQSLPLRNCSMLQPVTSQGGPALCPPGKAAPAPMAPSKSLSAASHPSWDWARPTAQSAPTKAMPSAQSGAGGPALCGPQAPTKGMPSAQSGGAGPGLCRPSTTGASPFAALRDRLANCNLREKLTNLFRPRSSGSGASGGLCPAMPSKQMPATASPYQYYPSGQAAAWPNVPVVPMMVAAPYPTQAASPAELAAAGLQAANAARPAMAPAPGPVAAPPAPAQPNPTVRALATADTLAPSFAYPVAYYPTRDDWMRAYANAYPGPQVQGGNGAMPATYDPSRPQAAPGYGYYVPQPPMVFMPTQPMPIPGYALPQQAGQPWPGYYAMPQPEPAPAAPQPEGEVSASAPKRRPSLLSRLFAPRPQAGQGNADANATPANDEASAPTLPYNPYVLPPGYVAGPTLAVPVGVTSTANVPGNFPQGGNGVNGVGPQRLNEASQR